MSDGSSAAPESGGQIHRGMLLGILGIGLLARLWRLVAGVEVVEIEGAEYASLARNLWESGDYLGVLVGSERMFPPLYPLLMGLVQTLTGVDWVLAGRLVSLAAGMTAVLLFAETLRRFAGPRLALIGAACMALHPGAILASVAVFSEMTGATFLLGGFLLAWSMIDRGGYLRALGAGACLGAAYLVRVENLAIGLVTLGLVALAVWSPAARARGLRKALPFVMAFSFVLVAAPYPHYLWRTTGEWRVQAKSERVMATIGRFAAGQDFQTASYEIGPELEERGPWLSPNADFDPPDPSAEGRVAFSAKVAYWFDNALGAGILLAGGKGIASLLFAVPGLWLLWQALRRGAARPRQIWRTRGDGRAFAERWLIAFVVLLFLTGIVYKVILRYFIPMAWPLGIWALRGVYAMAQRAGTEGRRVVWTAACAAILIASASRVIWSGVREFGEAHPRHAITREVGRELVPEQPHAVMSQDPRFAFYAGAYWEPLPVTGDAEAVVSWARRRTARWIALRFDGEGRALGLADQWYERGKPVPGLRVVRDEPDLVLLEVLPR